ncbi:hypothetical protein [Frigoribacterium sp. UYMn621]|uniref:hypothetical protein n=1 Tax=Frigoribacterium sp. UYMn621 TaxID=3156343 RepID=UPI003393FD18
MDDQTWQLTDLEAIFVQRFLRGDHGFADHTLSGEGSEEFVLLHNRCREMLLERV